MICGIELYCITGIMFILLYYAGRVNIYIPQ